MKSAYQKAAELPTGTVIEAVMVGPKKDIREVVELVRVDEGDCDFRTTDDGSEISFVWDMESFKVSRRKS